MELILDTCFVVSLEREGNSRTPGPATRFLESHLEDTMLITFTVAGELACGRSASAQSVWRRICQPYPVVPWSIGVSWEYGEIYRELATNGRLIGANDLWIAATAVVRGGALVTRNVDEFRRVQGLKVMPY